MFYRTREFDHSSIRIFIDQSDEIVIVLAIHANFSCYEQEISISRKIEKRNHSLANPFYALYPSKNPKYEGIVSDTKVRPTFSSGDSAGIEQSAIDARKK